MPSEMSQTKTNTTCVLSHFSCVQLFAAPWTVACQAPLSMGILQERILEWVVMLSSRGSSQPRVSCSCCIAREFFTTEPQGKPLNTTCYHLYVESFKNNNNRGIETESRKGVCQMLRGGGSGERLAKGCKLSVKINKAENLIYSTVTTVDNTVSKNWNLLRVELNCCYTHAHTQKIKAWGEGCAH